MSLANFPIKDFFNLGGYTATAGTAIAALIPPMRSPGVPAGSGVPAKWIPGKTPTGTSLADYTGSGDMSLQGRPVIMTLDVSQPTTAQSLLLMRPLNFTTVSAVAAEGQTSITIAFDPGIYSTNLRYPLAAGATTAISGGGTPPCQVADHGIAANDYVCYQLLDGTWFLDTVASVSAGPPIVLTMTTNVPAGTIVTANNSGVGLNAIMYYFGISTLKDPNTGLAPMKLPLVNQSTPNLWQDSQGEGIYSALHAGDPLMIYDANATTAATINRICGVYV